MSTNKMSVKNTFLLSINLLNKREKVQFLITSFVQIFLSFLDLIGVMLIGAIAALAINGISSKGPGDRVKVVLEILRIDNLTLQKQTFLLGAISAVLLISKTIFNYLISRKMSLFLSMRSAIITNDLFKRIIERDLIFIRTWSSQKIIFFLTSSVPSLVNGILVTGSTMLSDLVLTASLILGMAALDFKMALFTLIFYGLIAVFLNISVKDRYARLARQQSDYVVRSHTLLLDSLNSYRDILVRNAQQNVVSEFSAQRIKLANFAAEISVANNISKYLLEIALVIGSIIVCAYQFATQDASRAIATLAVFLASSARIVPAIMRVQQGTLTIKGTVASTEGLLEMIDSLNQAESVSNQNIKKSNKNSFKPIIKLDKVQFAYPNNAKFQLKDINLEIKEGELCAIVGPSGGGKSTIVDLILGVITQSNGKVAISGMPPRVMLRSFPGVTGYVPQEISILESTISENVAFYNKIDEEKVHQALANAQLSNLISELPEGINTFIGERGTRLSGGQRQRLGIARALYTNPKLLILDEATSALDAKTESEIAKTLKSLRGSKTLIVIAHRLSTVKDADRIIYIDKGEILADGSFNLVRKKVPNFDIQAKLLKL